MRKIHLPELFQLGEFRRTGNSSSPLPGRPIDVRLHWRTTCHIW